jgi:hypothetical protein
MSEDTPHGMRQPALPEAILGQVLWHVRVPSVSYGMYVSAQKAAVRGIKQKTYLKMMPVMFIAWLVIFLEALTISSVFNLNVAKSFYILLATTLLTILLYVGIQKFFIYRKLHVAAYAAEFDVVIGEKGVLDHSQNYVSFYSWEMLDKAIRNKHGLVLITQILSVVTVPEEVLRQVPDANAMLAFIEGKIAGAAEMPGSSPSGEG